MLKGNAIVGQSGGPTSVINASLAGVIEGAKGFAGIKRVLGMRYGIEGFMGDNVIDLGSEPAGTIEALKKTPSSALGSCRYKLKDADLPKVFDKLHKYDIRYIFMIGGNDTMDTIHRIEAFARQEKYELIGIGIPKTVDNDLFGTDHTPGFPSAARYTALSVMHAGILARDMKKVDQFVIYQSIGREAGWLAASSAMAKRTEDDAPHILCLPERKFDKAKFLADVKRVHDRIGWVSVVCGEGITFADGTPVSAAQARDKFNNVEFGAMGGSSAAIAIHKMIRDEFGFRGEFQVTESLPMSAADRVVALDIEEAAMCGRKAVELAGNGQTGVMVTLVREGGNKYSCVTGTIPLKEVAVHAKPMADKYINAEGNFVTQEFIEYMRPLVGELPQYANLSYKQYKI